MEMEKFKRVDTSKDHCLAGNKILLKASNGETYNIGKEEITNIVLV